MSTARRPDELLRFMREREQALAGSDRNHRIAVPCMTSSGAVTRAMR